MKPRRYDAGDQGGLIPKRSCGLPDGAGYEHLRPLSRSDVHAEDDLFLCFWSIAAAP